MKKMSTIKYANILSTALLKPFLQKKKKKLRKQKGKTLIE